MTEKRKIFGGDEFCMAVVCDHAKALNEKSLSDFINSTIQKLDGVSKKEYPIFASLGLACKIISSKTNIETMSSIADVNMYENKCKRKAQREDH